MVPMGNTMSNRMNEGYVNTMTKVTILNIQNARFITLSLPIIAQCMCYSVEVETTLLSLQD